MLSGMTDDAIYALARAYEQYLVLQSRRGFGVLEFARALLAECEVRRLAELKELRAILEGEGT